MRSFLENKRLVLLLAVLALGALTVLAISLNEVPLRAAEQFGREEAELSELSVKRVILSMPAVPLWKQVLFWVLASLLAVLVGLLVSPQFRKRFFRLLIKVVATVWAIYFFLKNFGPQILAGFSQPGVKGELDGRSFQPLPAFEPPQASSTLTYVISFAFALVWLVVIWGMYRGWKRYLQFNTKNSLGEIARIARSSLDDLSAGRNSSDVIINCYLRMNDVVSSKRHIQREAAMTPQEFALRLEQAGLPGDAVTRLTRLFEVVRYGDRKSGPRDVNEAVSCLETILHYCGEPL